MYLFNIIYTDTWFSKTDFITPFKLNNSDNYSKSNLLKHVHALKKFLATGI